MMTVGSVFIIEASSVAEIRTAVMANLHRCDGWKAILCLNVSPLRLSALVIGQHLLQLLGGGRDDGHEIGFAQAPLGAMALEVAARAAMEHGGVGGGDACFAGPEPGG